MTLWWIGSIVLLVVVFPIVVVPAARRARGGEEHRPERRGDRDRGGGRIEGPRRGARCCSRPGQVEQTVAGVADYGGSLDVIVDDADGGTA